MPKLRFLFVLLAALPSCAATQPARVAPSAPSTPVSNGVESAPLASLAWLAGTWKSSKPSGEILEETWSAPASDMMIGMGRAVSNGHTGFHEFLTIEAQPSGLVYTAIVSGKPVPFRLQQHHGNEWVFTNPEHDCPTRIVYRHEDDGSLFARVDGPKGCEPEDFVMVREPVASRAAIQAAPVRDLVAEHKAAYARATHFALDRDFDAALRELEPFARDTAASTDLSLAYWIRNQLTWLRWGRGDLKGALAETDLGAKALDRSTLGADKIAAMRLHALWDRAYLLLELGDVGAKRAFSEYEALAKERDDKDGLAVLTAFFAARQHRGPEAMLAAKRVDVEKDTDVQDLYVIALAFDAGGDRASAVAVRERICKGNDYLMKPLIVAQLEREHFTCK